MLQSQIIQSSICLGWVWGFSGDHLVMFPPTQQIFSCAHWLHWAFWLFTTRHPPTRQARHRLIRPGCVSQRDWEVIWFPTMKIHCLVKTKQKYKRNYTVNEKYGKDFLTVDHKSSVFKTTLFHWVKRTAAMEVLLPSSIEKNWWRAWLVCVWRICHP